MPVDSFDEASDEFGFGLGSVFYGRYVRGRDGQDRRKAHSAPVVEHSDPGEEFVDRSVVVRVQRLDEAEAERRGDVVEPQPILGCGLDQIVEEAFGRPAETSLVTSDALLRASHSTTTKHVDRAARAEGVRTGVPIRGRADQYGQRWAVDVPLAGPQGSIPVRAAWILDLGSTTPRLVTISFPEEKVNLHDVVRLVVDLPDEGLSAGAVGAVVHVFEKPSLAYEVEFTDEDGRTIAQLPFPPGQIQRVDA